MRWIYATFCKFHEANHVSESLPFVYKGVVSVSDQKWTGEHLGRASIGYRVMGRQSSLKNFPFIQPGQPLVILWRSVKLSHCHLCFQPLIKKWVLICKDLGCMKQQSKASTVLIVGQMLWYAHLLFKNSVLFWLLLLLLSFILKVGFLIFNSASPNPFLSWWE